LLISTTTMCYFVHTPKTRGVIIPLFQHSVKHKIDITWEETGKDKDQPGTGTSLGDLGWTFVAGKRGDERESEF